MKKFLGWSILVATLLGAFVVFPLLTGGPTALLIVGLAIAGGAIICGLFALALGLISGDMRAFFKERANG